MICIGTYFAEYVVSRFTTTHTGLSGEMNNSFQTPSVHLLCWLLLLSSPLDRHTKVQRYRRAAALCINKILSTHSLPPSRVHLFQYSNAWQGREKEEEEEVVHSYIVSKKRHGSNNTSHGGAHAGR